MKVLVLGGGPAGMTAALAAARAGAEVLLLEQNERIGKKLLLTGNGKCNYTNLELDVARYDTDGPDFVRELIKRYPPKTIIRFLEELGVPPLSRHGGWIYPHAEQAAAVLNALRTALEREQVAVRTGTRILGIQREKKGGFRIRTEEKPLYADRVILALGGSALAKTGSDGSGFRYAEELGLKLEAPRPALCPLRSAERENPFFRAAQGVRVPAELTLFVDNAARGRESGEVQLQRRILRHRCVSALSLRRARARGKAKDRTLHKLPSGLYGRYRLLCKTAFPAVCDRFRGGRQRFGAEKFVGCIAAARSTHAAAGGEAGRPRARKKTLRSAHGFPLYAAGARFV